MILTHRRRVTDRGIISAIFNGSAGGFYNLAQSTVSQDDAGATPTTTAGQSIGRVTDLSGNGATLTQATSGARPIYRIDAGGRPYAEHAVGDTLAGTFADLGSDATIAYATRYGVVILTAQTVSGLTTLLTPDWYAMLYIDRALTTAEETKVRRLLNYLSNGADSDLWSAIHLDFAGSQQLDDRITFTRAGASGGYYDGKTMVKAEENLFTNSGQGATNWIVFGAGGKTATTVTGVTVNDGAYLSLLSTIAIGEVYTVSVELSGTGVARLHVLTPSGGAVDPIDVTLTATPTRYSITHTASVVGISAGMALSGIDGTPVTATVDKMQFEIRSAATAYTATTTAPITTYIPLMLFAAANEPVFNFDPVTGVGGNLRVEGARTNLLTYNRDFSNAAWTKANATIDSNVLIAPDGTLTMDKLVEGSGAVAPSAAQTLGDSPAGTYTYSVRVKSAGRNLRLNISLNGGGAAPVFNLQTGSVISGTGTITHIGNDVYLCTATATSTGNSNGYAQYLQLADDAGAFSYTGDGYSGIYIWGAQLETGSKATSLIKTEASQVTLLADSLVMTGENFSSWYNQSEGTFVVDGTAAATCYVLVVDDGTLSNRMEVVQGTSGDAIGVVKNGVTVALLGARALTAHTAFSYRADDFALSVNGGLVSTDINGGVPLVDRLSIGVRGPDGALPMNGEIASITYYPKRLTNAELQALTT